MEQEVGADYIVGESSDVTTESQSDRKSEMGQRCSGVGFGRMQPSRVTKRSISQRGGWNGRLLHSLKRVVPLRFR